MYLFALHFCRKCPGLVWERLAEVLPVQRCMLEHVRLFYLRDVIMHQGEFDASAKFHTIARFKMINWFESKMSFTWTTYWSINERYMPEILGTYLFCGQFIQPLLLSRQRGSRVIMCNVSFWPDYFRLICPKFKTTVDIGREHVCVVHNKIWLL